MRSSYVRMLWVISSTANVAIPAARPDSRISGMPTTNAAIPPTIAAIARDVTLPVCRWTRKCARFGMIAGFSLVGTESTPAVQAPSATKLMCPNDRTPELPMKTYNATTIETLTSVSVK
jgi:hypothetical protein